MTLIDLKTVILLLALAPLCPNSYAQDDSRATRERAEIPADDFGRGTPLRTSGGFLSAVDKGDYDTAAEYLDLRNLQGEARNLTGPQLARRMSVIVNRAIWVDIDELVDDPAGREHDNLPGYRDSIGVIMDDDKEVRLLLQKVPRGDGVSVWKVSNATVSMIPKLYATYGYAKLIEDLRRNLPKITFLGYELFKWVILLSVAVVTYAIVFLLAILVRRSLAASDSRTRQRVFHFMALPLAIWLVVILVNVVAGSLGSGVTAEKWRDLTPIPTLITVWLMFVLIKLLRDVYASRLQQRGKTSAAILLRPISSALMALVIVSAALTYLSQIGVNITTMLAGLGVGGIAIALALQKPVEDVFGAITLYTQQPVRVGDFCRIGDHTGTIEEIGLRTTRLRTLANTVIAVPNSLLANEPIDNYSARQKIWYRPYLRLRYDTSPAALKHVLDGIRDMLKSHEEVLQDNARVRFKEISSDALLVEVFAYLNTTDWVKYLEMAEKLNIGIPKVVADAGTSLALPSRTLNVENKTVMGNTLLP
jgi:MscS family membrane protein